eukprot:4438472-Amphidinium_carterae.1
MAKWKPNIAAELEIDDEQTLACLPLLQPCLGPSIASFDKMTEPVRSLESYTPHPLPRIERVTVMQDLIFELFFDAKFQVRNYDLTAFDICLAMALCLPSLTGA